MIYWIGIEKLQSTNGEPDVVEKCLSALICIKFKSDVRKNAQNVRLKQIKSVDPFSDDFLQFCWTELRSSLSSIMQRFAKWIELTTTMRVIEK